LGSTFIYFGYIFSIVVGVLKNFGYKNFTIKSTIIGLIIGVSLVNIGFYLLKRYINQRFNEKQITTFKSFFEYTLIFLVIYFVLF